MADATLDPDVPAPDAVPANLAIDPNVNLNNVNPKLLQSISQAAQDYPYNVVIKSGYREGDPRFHGQGKAIDVQLVDPDTGKAIPNYQSESSFRTYEQFAQKVRQVQTEQFPELNNSLRWGGYFPGATGPLGKYGAVDLMHFDVGGDSVAMGGGTWDKGLSPEQRQIIPGAVSVGIQDLPKTAQTDSGGYPAPGQSSFDKAQTIAAANIPPSHIAQLLAAYQSGKMAPDDRAQFEQDVSDGRVMLPTGLSLGGKATKPGDSAIELPQATVDAYNNAANNPYDLTNKLTVDDRKQMDMDIRNGIVKLPSGAILNQTYPGILDNIKESITGAQRSTPASNAAPELATEGTGLLAGLGIPPAKQALAATALLTSTDPQNMAAILKAQSPEIGITQDEKGNLYVANNKTGVGPFIINRPGVSPMDFLQTAGLLSAFGNPATMGAKSIVGAAASNAATQAAIEGASKAAGGSFNTGNVVGAGVIGGAIPLAARLVGAAKGAIAPAAGEANPAAVAATEDAAKAGPAIDPNAPPAASETTPATSAAPSPVPPGAAAASPVADAVSAAAPAATQEADAAVQAAARASGTEAPLNTADAIARRQAITEARTQAVANSPDVAASKENVAKIAAEHGEMSDAHNTALADHQELVNSVADNAATHAAPTAVAPLSGEALAQTAKEASSGGFGSARATNILATQAAPDAERLAAANRLGIADYLQPDHVTTNQSFRELSQALKSIPGSEGRAQELQGLQQVANRADNLITDIGGSHDISSVSDSLKAQMSATQQALDRKSSSLYSQINEAIPKQTEAPATDTLDFLKQRADDLGGAQNLSPMEKMMLSKLTPKKVETPGAVDPEIAAIQAKADAGQTLSRAEGMKILQSVGKEPATQTALKQPTYALLDDVRKDIGNAAFKNAGPFKDEDKGLLKKYYGILTGDQEKIADAMGQSKIWQLAKQTVAMRKGMEDDLSSLFGKNIDGSITTALGTAITAAAKGDGTKLVNMLKSIPENMRQQVVASGLATAFGKNFRNGSLNFNTFTHWYEGLAKNKQAYTAVMMNLPQEARSQLADLYQVSKGIALASKERITTGRIQAIKEGFQEVDSLMQRMYSVGGHVAKNAGKALIADAIGGHGAGIGMAFMSALKASGKSNTMKAADALLASPDFAAAAKGIASGEPAKVSASQKMLAYSKPFVKFAKAVGNPREMSNREKWISDALNTANNEKGNK